MEETSTPTKMLAIVMESKGATDVLQLREVPRPDPADGEVLVRILATSVNPLDWKIRKGEVPFIKRPRSGRVLGFDIAGEVVQRGRATGRFKPGDLVFGMLPSSGGGNAELVSVSEKVLSRKPANLSFTEAASVPLVGTSALQALRDHGKLSPGESVMIYGASGGVGSIAVQIAKAMGARVTAVSGTRNQDFTRKLGADEVEDYQSPDFKPAPRRYDVIFDTVGKLDSWSWQKALKENGRFVSTLPSLKTAVLAVASPVLMRRSVKILVAHPSGRDMETLREYIEAGKVLPRISRTYSIRELAQAHARSESGHVAGKIAVTVDFSAAASTTPSKSGAA